MDLATQFYDVNVYHSGSTGDGAAVISKPAGAKLRLLSVVADNFAGADRWCMVFDAAAQPSNTTVPLISIRMSSATQQSLDLSSINGYSFSNGICICSSTTGKTLTAGASTDLWLSVFWV